MGRERLTRQEQQARTRSRLMNAASKVFSCKGMQQASIDEVAQEAGYTKGAFYANFKSKEELFLAMLDEQFAQRLEELEELMEADLPLADVTRMAGEQFTIPRIFTIDRTRSSEPSSARSAARISRPV